MSQNDLYEYQFWGFTGDELSSGLRKVILEIIHKRINHLYVSLKKKAPKEGWPVPDCQIILDEYFEKSTEHMNSLETHIKENFKIPPHILLEEDSVQRQQYSEEDKKQLFQEIQELSKKINKVHLMEFHLLQELEKNKELKTICKQVQECSLPPIDGLPNSKKLHQIMSECLGLEVQEANCNLKEEDPGESNLNQPNHLTAIFKKTLL